MARQNKNGGLTGQTKKQFKNKLLWVKFILIVALFITTIVLLALSPLFNIRQITVEGNKHCKREDIICVTDISIGNNGFKTIGKNVLNIFTLRDGNAEKNILQSSPYIKDVKARYVIPDKVVIYINEREPVGIIPYLGTNLLIDGEQIIVDSIADSQGSGLPIIKGIKLLSYKLGQALKVENPSNLNAAIKIIHTIIDSDKSTNLKLFDLTGSIDVTDTNKVCLFVDNRIVVNLGDLNELSYRISFLKQIYIKSLKKEERGLLDFTNGSNPNFIPEK